MNATTLSKRSGGQAWPAPIQKGWLTGIAGAILPWLVLLSLTGCATPTTLTTVVAGIEITEHLDDRMPPGCEQAFPTGGCYKWQNGKHNIWYSVVSLPHVREHEIAHALGMRHTAWTLDDTAWTWGDKQQCVFVTVSGGEYLQGQRICIDSRGEHTYAIHYANQQVGG